MWFTEVVPDRLNHPEDSVIVVIQQRLHEEDVSGTALDRELGYTHLCIPMEYVPHPFVNGYDVEGKIRTFDMSDEDDKQAITGVFWQDPRTEDGELAWPIRFGPKQIDELKKAKGPYAWCSCGEAPVLMSDMSLKRIDKVQVGDDIIGFSIGDIYKRARLRKAKVLSISVSEQPVVRMTLSSGEIIRCTANHKWWTRRNDSSHRPYACANLGTVLPRVCPPRLPEITKEEDIRLAGWLSGFFDGEGSVSLNHRRGDESSPLITFTQGDGRNGPLCDKLEMVLDHFGFNWGVRHKHTKGDHNLRYYWLKMAKEGRASRFPLYQRFLHIVQPVKWRDRIIDAATSGRLYTGSDKVLSIEPDGIETVYGLETTTGNYVVWGLASSNSGQYQQTPEIRGGSIIRRDYWQDWDSPKFPDFEYILASIDTAYTEKQENDASAMTLWGLFRDANNNPKIMLMHAWQERLEINKLVNRVVNYCTVDPREFGHPRWPVDRLLIEAKATGLSVAQEIRRIIGFEGQFGIELINPTKAGDKVARAHSILHLFTDGMIYAPTSRAWCQEVIDQSAKFPKGSHDDYVDATTQALRYLRDNGMALMRREHEFDMEEEMRYKPRLEALYPV
jgi:predicted phage terminase large subunit-like protein